MKTNLLLFSVLLFAACHSIPASENKKADSLSIKNIPAESSVNPNFRAFIGKFRVLQLPLTFKPTDLGDYNSLPLLYGADSNYIKAPIDTSMGKLFAYGLLADTTDSYKIIWLTPADIYVPVLTTFTKKGTQISEDYIGVGGCGSDCCFECNETVIINKALSVYSADSIQTCDCDDNGPKTETMRKYVRFKTAQISTDGKFTFTEVSEKKQ